MIAVVSREGQWLRTLGEPEGFFVHHPRFGILSERVLRDRVQRRQRAGLRADVNGPSCRFRLKLRPDGSLAPAELEGCEAVSEGRVLRLKTPWGEFGLIPVSGIAAPDLARAEPLVGPRQERSFARYLAAAALFILFAGFLASLVLRPGEVAPEALEPVRVTLVPEVPELQQRQKVVAVPAASDLSDQLKVRDRATRVAVEQNLGFLGLIGKKDLTKALGGLPTTTRPASAGAGAGGTEGSGGEYLVGLGQGVRRATVGNTGVAGLGGIGTKGAGGGAGGYGDSLVGSGEGRTLSKVALSNELTLEGGLDRSVIQATIAKYLSQVRACYEEQLRGNPGLAGQVTAAFSIDGEGLVTTSRISRSTLGSAAAEGCIAARIRTWSFPKPVGGVTVKVNYPFLLRPAGA